MPETQLSGLVQFLETIIDPATTVLGNAPRDDEPETDEEKAACSEARQWLQNSGGKAFRTMRPRGGWVWTRARRSSWPCGWIRVMRLPAPTWGD